MRRTAQALGLVSAVVAAADQLMAEASRLADILLPERTRGHGGGQAADRRCDGPPDRCGIARRDGAAHRPPARNARRAARASPPSSRSASRPGKADVRQAPHRQSRRDRLPRHPHGAAPGHPHGRGLFRGRCRRLHVALADEAWPSARRRRARAISRGEKIIAAARRPAPRRSIPAMASSRRMPISPRLARRPASSSSARRPPPSAPWARRARPRR